MNQCQGRLVIFILEICKKGSQLTYQKHSLIDNRSAGKRRDVSVLVALFEYAANNIQLSVKYKVILEGFRPLDKCLADHRTAVQRLLSQHTFHRGNLSPAQESQALLLHDDLKHLLRLAALQLILRKKEHTHTVFPFPADGDSFLLTDLCKEAMGDLSQNADTVSGLSFGILAGTML